MAVFIRRIRNDYTVIPQPLPDDIDDGRETIGQFLDDYANGRVDLAAVYTSLTNSMLRQIPEISEALKFRGGT